MLLELSFTNFFILLWNKFLKYHQSIFYINQYTIQYTCTIKVMAFIIILNYFVGMWVHLDTLKAASRCSTIKPIPSVVKSTTTFDLRAILQTARPIQSLVTDYEKGQYSKSVSMRWIYWMVTILGLCEETGVIVKQ